MNGYNKPLENVNYDQFVHSKSNLILVLAGPGTGKSFNLKKRIEHLLLNGEKPEQIMAVTFTRTAANDLKSDINQINIDGSDRIVASTLHSYCFSILNKQQIIRKNGRVPRVLMDYEKKVMLSDIDDKYGSVVQKEKVLNDFEAYWATLQSDTPGFCTDNEKEFEREICSWLVFHKAMLFGEMIIQMYDYLRKNPDCEELNQFNHILVDEYQDLNKAEQMVIELLSIKGNLAVIGDDDQSIYSFKHAHPDGIRTFPGDGRRCEKYTFNVCRRCPKRVVSMASKLISKNDNRVLGDLLPLPDNNQGIVHIIQFNTLNKEIVGVCEIINKEILNGNYNPKDFLILVPYKDTGKEVKKQLEKKGVCAELYSTDPFQTLQSKKSFSILKLLCDDTDMVSWRYLIGHHKKGFLSKEYRIIWEYSIANNIDLIEILDALDNGNLKLKKVNTIPQIYSEIKTELLEIRSKIGSNRSLLPDIIGLTEKESFLKRLISDSLTRVGLMEESSVSMWINTIYNDINENLKNPNFDEDNHVRIMTLHLSKGLSSKFVIVMNCVQGMMGPIVNSNKYNIKTLEETRRLFYVAITRCKTDSNNPGTLILTCCKKMKPKDARKFGYSNNDKNNYVTVNESRFLEEFNGTAPEMLCNIDDKVKKIICK